MRRFITIRASAEVITEFAIDAAIAAGLEELKKRHCATMSIVNATAVFRGDGIPFVTIIAEETAQIPATIKTEGLSLAIEPFGNPFKA